jgi:hypothetical protein
LKKQHNIIKGKKQSKKGKNGRVVFPHGQTIERTKLEADEEDEKVMRQIYSALKLRGKFLIDVANRDRKIKN